MGVAIDASARPVISSGSDNRRSAYLFAVENVSNQSIEIDQTSILCRDDPVALTSPVLEEDAIDDFHHALPPPYGAILLESLQSCRYSCSSGAHHHRQELMRERNRVVLRPVVGQQQQSRQPLLEPVAGAAQDRLRILDRQGLYMIHQLLTKRRAFIHCATEIVRGDLQGLARHLHKTPVRRPHGAEYDRHADESRTADNRHSNLAVLPGASQGDRHAALDEMHPVDRTMRFLKDLVALQLSPPQFGLQSRQYRGRQTRQNAILSGSQLKGARRRPRIPERPRSRRSTPPPYRLGLALSNDARFGR